MAVGCAGDGLYGPATRAEGPKGGKCCLLLMPEDGGKERHLDPPEGAGIKCPMFEGPLFYSVFLILRVVVGILLSDFRFCFELFLKPQCKLEMLKLRCFCIKRKTPFSPAPVLHIFTQSC